MNELINRIALYTENYDPYSFMDAYDNGIDDCIEDITNIIRDEGISGIIEQLKKMDDDSIEYKEIMEELQKIKNNY